jgi:cytochrome b pre-mRNA-processing protein 3
MPLFRRHTQQQRSQADAIYQAIVAQARSAEFYRDYGVPDTLDGRFEMLTLLACLYFRRLRSEDESARRTGQTVFDTMFRDMDASLRELGVGDLTVPKKIKVMGEAFYGRASAYDGALAMDGDEALSSALARNIWPDSEGAETRSSLLLARWVRESERALARQPIATLNGSGPTFAPPASLLAGAER